jgi:hypothetical protein
MIKVIAGWFSSKHKVMVGNASQQSVHLTLGILRTSQAVSHALSFFWLDGFAVPAPAQVTQTVGRLSRNDKIKGMYAKSYS